MKATLLSFFLIILFFVCSQAQSGSSSATPSPAVEKAANGSDHVTASSDKVKAGKAVRLPPEKAQPVTLPRFDNAPVIDGKLEDEPWKSAAVFKDFYQWRPSDKSPASARTEVFAGYDSRFIYFAFHAYDEPSKVRATVADVMPSQTMTLLASFSTLSMTSGEPTSCCSIPWASSKMDLSPRAAMMTSVWTL